MHPRFILAPALLAWAAAWAQPGSQNSPQPAPAGREPLQKPEQLEDRRTQKVERIRHEDAGSVIDEVRYGGQTQSITVQPKANVPGYEIQPGGTRVWNVLRF